MYYGWHVYSNLDGKSDHPSPMIKKVLPRRYGQHMPPTLSNCRPTSLRPISFFADKKRWTLTYRHEVAEANLKRWLNDTNIWFSYRDWPTSSQLHIFRFEPSVKLRAQIGPDSAAKRRRPKPLRTRANFSPQRNLRLPEKTQCFVQILTFKSHPWCSSSNAICQEWLANTQYNRMTQHFYSALLLPLRFSSLVFSTLPLVYL